MPHIRIVAYGSQWMLTCSECGDLLQMTSLSRREIHEHRRSEHPTEDEAEMDHLMAVAAELPGCGRCGHDDHDDEDCPFVTPDLLKSAGTL